MATTIQLRDLTLIDRATAFAAKAHREQLRKQHDVPYFSHPSAVAIHLAIAGADATTIAAALLHDVVEDTPATHDDLVREFGSFVAGTVRGTTEHDKDAPWLQRKQAFLQRLRHGSPYRVLLVVAADKAHNLRDMLRGAPDSWNRLNAPKGHQRWFYHSLCRILEHRHGPVFDHLRTATESAFGPIPDVIPGPD